MVCVALWGPGPLWGPTEGPSILSLLLVKQVITSQQRRGLRLQLERVGPRQVPEPRCGFGSRGPADSSGMTQQFSLLCFFDAVIWKSGESAADCLRTVSASGNTNTVNYLIMT